MDYTATELARIHDQARACARVARDAAVQAFWAGARAWLGAALRSPRPLRSTRHHSMEA